MDRGAYGTKGRRGGQQAPSSASASGQPKTNGGAGAGSSGDERSGSGDTAKGQGAGEKVAEGGKSVPAGPPPSIQGRGRMVGLGHEIEMGGLFNTQWVFFFFPACFLLPVSLVCLLYTSIWVSVPLLFLSTRITIY